MDKEAAERYLDAIDEYPPVTDEELATALNLIERWVKEPPSSIPSGLRLAAHWLRLQREFPAIEEKEE